MKYPLQGEGKQQQGHQHPPPPLVMNDLAYHPRQTPRGPPIPGIKQAFSPLLRFIYNNPIYTGVIFYAFFISIRHLRTAGKQRGPFIWQVKGASLSHKGSCFCSASDDSCWCGPSLGVDTILEYSEKENGPVSALVFIKRKDGRGMSCVGGFVQLGETVEEAVNRKVQEEIGTTSLNSLRLLGVYSHSERDDRRHTVSAVYVGKVHGKFKAGDDAKIVSVIPLQAMNVELIRLSFDHNNILKDYWYSLKETVVERNLMPRQGTSLCSAPPRDEDQE